MKLIKEKIYKNLQYIISTKINDLKANIKQVKQDRNNDTKSSAGDKFETGREMMQIELNKNETQLNKIILLQNELQQININKNNKTAIFGSLVVTNNEKYFLSISIGKLKIEQENYYCISLASPLGKILQNKNIGNIFNFQGREFVIEAIY